ncbi:peptide deformylase [Longispora fulva]|uniref:Peptide deformylase n=1 Tax=Longispora fulva TaxID=619741 RepID=A0A8J7KP88_9ACTN|nr:peptide deformylase [Longispora fulva]MBG6136032.1 peptide deformylase [Longispora fulva]
MTLVRSNQQWIDGVATEGIRTIGDPLLKAHAAAVDDPATVAGLLDFMVQRLRNLKGTGLAAPQVGASVRVLVIEVRKTDVFPDRPTHPLLQMINPIITNRSGVQVDGWEGCFSVPGLMGQVPRDDRITVRFLTSAGESVEDSFTGNVARVVQHEIDHLDGTVFLQRMATLDSVTTVANYLTHHRTNRS